MGEICVCATTPEGPQTFIRNTQQCHKVKKKIWVLVHSILFKKLVILFSEIGFSLASSAFLV